MTKFSAPTIEQALLQASKELKCSIVDLEYEILEKPSKGFLGLGKKDAKIVVSFKHKNRAFRGDRNDRSDRNEGRFDFKNSESKMRESRDSRESKGRFNAEPDFKPQPKFNAESKPESKRQFNAESAHDSREFTSAKEFISDALVAKISAEIDELFALLPIKLTKIEVSKFDKNTIMIHFKGADCALLIGERGYRYKAISYLLFNWLNAEYGVNVRLEIESFLADQEAMMSSYLAPIIENVRDLDEPFTTKTFDGILAYIALKELRAKLRDKTVLLKTNENDEHYIVIEPQHFRPNFR